MTHRQLAEQIAADLFTDGDGKEYERLNLVPAERTDNLSWYSWGRAAVIDRIEQHLKSYFLTTTDNLLPQARDAKSADE